MISRIFQSLGNPCKLIEVYIISVFYTVRIRYSIWMAKRTQLKNSRIEPLRRLNKFSIIHPNDWAYSAYRPTSKKFTSPRFFLNLKHVPGKSSKYIFEYLRVYVSKDESGVIYFFFWSQLVHREPKGYSKII